MSTNGDVLQINDIHTYYGAIHALKATDEVGHRPGLARVHAGRRLVEQQQLRVARERARHLQTSLVSIRKVLRELVLD